jgi:hypothetical protein
MGTEQVRKLPYGFVFLRVRSLLVPKILLRNSADLPGLFHMCFRKTGKTEYQLHLVCLFVCSSKCNNSAPTGRIFNKFDI